MGRIGVYKELETGTYLALNAGGDDETIRVVAVDKLGMSMDGGHLLSISTRGVSFPQGINPKLGMPVDEDGSLICLK